MFVVSRKSWDSPIIGGADGFRIRERRPAMGYSAFVPAWLNGSPPCRILMADPDESFLLPYRMPLSEAGFEVATASDGLQCVTRLRQRAPHVLVLEPQLPGGGADVLTTMGTIPDLAIVPVMVLTLHRHSRELDSLAHLPIDDYFVKPLAPERLLRRIHTMLDHPGPRFTLSARGHHLEYLIWRRTGGRIRNLRVETSNGRVVVYGRSSSYYVKQLAIAAVMEACEASACAPEEMELNLEVCTRR